MSNETNFSAGDFLIFQIESGFGLIRILRIDSENDEIVWHVAAFGDYFPDIESAENALENVSSINPEIRHVALTNRAFLSTQVSRLGNSPITEAENEILESWKANPVISDRSIRLLLGVR
ncbi:MAG: hypothetical protein ACK42A_03370 [Pyrinomonadaceae bacterium]|jgi:hypothetical protein